MKSHIKIMRRFRNQILCGNWNYVGLKYIETKKKNKMKMKKR
jgi:hypothetical protein